MGYMNINLLGDVFADLHLEDVGALAFELEHDWFTKEDLVIRDAPAGGGNLLTEGVDYVLSTESIELSARVTAAVGAGRTVYHEIAIINVAYQAGDLYFSGKYIADSNDALDMIPPGLIAPYGGAAAPDGWLLCDGSAVSRWTYRRLFAVIGTSFGVGDGTTTFNMPNMQSVSPTGVGAQDIAGRTKTGPALGEVREDAMQGHYHEPLPPGTGIWTVRAGAGGVDGATGAAQGYASTGSPVTDGINDTPRTGAYTHGPELGVNFIIKT